MLRNLWHHFLLITRHRHKVIAHCKKAGILWQGLRHDLSKYSPTEFIPGVKYYQGNRSPNEKEREILGYSLAWLHHKGRNRHHFEYWTDYNPVENESHACKNASPISGRDVLRPLSCQQDLQGRTVH